MTSSASKSFEDQPLLSQQLTAVDVAKIESELKALWKQAAQPADDSSQTVMIRACSLNVILFSADDKAESEGSDLLDDILVHHPARGILAIFRPDKPASLSAWVSTRCHIAGTSKQICSEQITVCSEGGHIRQLSSVVLPLVLPDLPVFLWWRHGRIDRQAYKALHECARRFIVDSGRADADVSLLLDTCELIETQHGCLWVSDLNWRRLMPWLESFADAFDGFPMPIAHLGRITDLVVTYQGGPSACLPSQPLLLCSWLASRLGWKPVEFSPTKENAYAKFSANGKSITVRFKESQPVRPDNMQSGQILKVECNFDDQRVLTAAIEQSKELSFIIAKEGSVGMSEATRIDTSASEAVLVGQEVEVLGSDPIYERTMQLLSQLLKSQEKP